MVNSAHLNLIKERRRITMAYAISELVRASDLGVRLLTG